MQKIPTARASEVSFNEGVLRLAAIHGRVVQFRYAKSDSAPIEMRSFIPEAVAVTSDGKLVVFGPDSDRDAYRAFRIDRIKGDVRFP